MLKLNNIYLGDSYELIKQLPDNSIDLIITDPPYEYTTGGKNNYVSERPYHKEYYEVSKNTYRQEEHKINQRNELHELSFGIDYSILDDFVRVMKKINIYIWCSKHMLPNILNYFLDKGCNYEILFWG